MTFYALAFIPGLIALVVIGLWVADSGWSFATTGATVGCLAAVASPWFALWYAWNILQDHTANMGAGLLVLAQPLFVPVSVGLGVMFGGVLSRLLTSRQDSTER